MKYRRLIKMVLCFGLLASACGFVGTYLWDYGFSAEGISDGLVWRALDALSKGMIIGGLVFSFPMWLVLEKFRRPESRNL